MMIRKLGLACLLVVLAWGSSARAQYLISPGSNVGGQLQIGTGLPLPVTNQKLMTAPGIFFGGMSTADAGNFPPLLVRPNPAKVASIMQGLSTAAGGKLSFAPGVLTNKIATMTPRAPIGVFPTNPAVFQVRTSIDYSWPNVAAVFAPGGGPFVPGTPAEVFPGPGGGSITYSGSVKSFGGPAQFAITAGPDAGKFRVPVNGTKVPIASVWINAFGKLPGSATKALIVGASNYLGKAPQGASLASPTATTMFGVLAKDIVAFPAAAMTMNGAIDPMLSAGPFTGPPLTNMVTGTKGFPWTTGAITISNPGAVPAEVFYAKGTDMRVAGVGNVSLVSGALGLRKLSGGNSNRGWLSLTIPEPTAALGAAGALAMLTLCHALVRRRAS